MKRKIDLMLSDESVNLINETEQTAKPSLELQTIPCSKIVENEEGQHKWLILIVEDNPANQLLILLQLKHLGYCAEVAANGVEAVAAIRQKHYDLVLMDCQMPYMDGYEATQLIRQIEQQRQQERIPILAVTANTVKGNLEKCLKAGMNDYLTKPVLLSQLQLTLKHWLSLIPERRLADQKGNSQI